MTPTAWSSFLTGLNPGGHGIFNFTSNPNRAQSRVENAASRSGTPFWRPLGAAGVRSAFVTIPFTYPPEPIEGILVTGYGGPERPAILPEGARRRIQAAQPDLVTAHHPMGERWWEDFPRYTQRLLDHVEQIADVCRLSYELEPGLDLLCVDFMSSDHIGHLGWHRLDPEHPAHDPDDPGDEIVRVYEAIDAACAHLIDVAGAATGEEPTAIVLSDHGMRPIHWMFHINRWLEEAGHLRYRRRSLQRLKGTRLDYVSKVDQRLARTRRGYGRRLDHIPFLPQPGEERAFGEIDFGSTRAYSYGAGGQVFLGEASGARSDPGSPNGSRRSSPRSGTQARASRRSRCAARRSSTAARTWRRRRSSSSSRTTSASTSMRAAAAGRRRSTATRSSTRASTPASRATTASPGSWPRRGRGSGRPPYPRARRSPRWPRRSSASSASSRTGSTARRSTTCSASSRRSAAPRVRRCGDSASEGAVYSEEEERVILERLRDLGYE